MYIREIKDICDGAKTWVRMVERDSEFYLVEMGLRQGFVLIVGSMVCAICR